MGFAHRFLTLLCPTGGEINVVCPTITPTLGAELLSNGDFADWTGDDPDDWSVTEAPPTREVSEVGTGQGHGGAGNGYCNLYRNGGGSSIDPRIQEGITANAWHHISFVVDTLTAGQLHVREGSATYSCNYGATGVMSLRAVGSLLRMGCGADPSDMTIDDVSAKAITFSSMLAHLGDVRRQTGAWTCTPTCTLGTLAGIVINYADTNNLLVAYVHRGAPAAAQKAFLDQRDGGIWSNLRNGAITYGAGKTLAIYIDGTTAKLYYDGGQVGADATITASGLGTQVYGFSAYTSNAVGLVATRRNPNP